MLDTVDRVLFSNAAARGLLHPLSTGLKYSDEAFFGPGSVVTPEDGLTQDVHALLAESARHGHGGEQVYAVDRPRTGRQCLRLQAVPLFDELNCVAGTALIFHDITEEAAGRAEGEWLRRELLATTERVEELLRLSEALNSISRTIHSTLDFAEIMDRVVAEIACSLDVDFCTIHARSGDRWEFRYAYGLPPALVEMRLRDDEAPLSVHVLGTRQSLISNDVQHDARANARLMSRFDITALIAVPLEVRGESMGVLFAGCLGRSADFREEHVDFLSKAAGSLALALENARLYDAERSVAEQLQAALLALPAHIPGVDFAHAYHSADESAHVGGDFYDLFELDYGQIGMVIGDVAGKGLEAALLTSMVRNTIRAYANEKRRTPARILELTNDVVFRETVTESFVTIFFGLFDPRDGRLVYCNAGHTAAAVRHSDGDVAELTQTGPLLGAFGGVGYAQSETRLEPGETLFLYTDGLTEARRAGEMYGDARLRAVLGQQVDATARETIERVVQDVLVFSEYSLRDDLAMLAIRLTEEAGAQSRQQKLAL